MKRSIINILVLFIIIEAIVLSMTGCANIIPPSGGPKDTIPPRLAIAIPKDSAVNVKNNRITLTFDEFVDVKEVQQNLIVSPNPKNSPVVNSKLKNVTIKLRDTLEPNTTYSLNFGNSIKDVNEGNILKGFTYVFSTGNYIDSNTLSGKVILAETGRFDSSLIVVLHNNLADSVIVKNRPRYYTKVNSKGLFTFKHLPFGRFNVFVIPNDYSKRYDDSTKMFAFSDTPVVVGKSTPVISLYAYEEAKKKPANKPASSNNNNKSKPLKEDKKLHFSFNLDGKLKDILNDTLLLTCNKKLKQIDTSKIILTDTNYHRIKGYTFYMDSSQTKIAILNHWKEGAPYKLLMAKDAVTDSLGTILTKADTINFTSKKESEYGSLKLRFGYYDVTKHPVLQFIQNDKIVESVPIKQKEFYRKLFYPGDYELRILFDANGNGIWDPGNYKQKRQPEVVFKIDNKISVRGNWDNEVDVHF